VVLAEIAEELVRKVLAQYPEEKTISLVAISVSHLHKLWDVQLELPLGSMMRSAGRALKEALRA